jgi:hypothetical protein
MKRQPFSWNPILPHNISWVNGKIRKDRHSQGKFTETGSQGKWNRGGVSQECSERETA